MAFGGCVDDDAGENLIKYDELRRQINKQLSYGRSRLNSNSIKTDTEENYWEGYVDALENIL